MSDYILSATAKDNLNDIWLHIFELSRDVEFADSFVESFTTAFETIAQTPKIGESREYLRPGFRKWNHRKYIIYYKPQENIVRIEQISWGRSQQLRRS